MSLHCNIRIYAKVQRHRNIRRDKGDEGPVEGKSPEPVDWCRGIALCLQLISVVG